MSNRLKSIIITTIVLSLNSSVTLAANHLLVKQTVAQSLTNIDKKAEADKLLQQGIKQSNTKQIDAALLSLQKALAIYQEIKDRPGQGQALTNLGNIYADKKENAKAIEAYQQSLIIAWEIKNRNLEARNLLNLGSVYSNEKNYDKALEFLQQSWQIAQEIKSRLLQYKLLSQLIQTYSDKGDIAKAQECKQQAQTMFAEIIKLGQVLDLLGKVTAYNQQKKYPEAVESGEKALEDIRKIKINNEDILILFSSLSYLENKSISPEFINFLFETQILEELTLAYRAISDYPKLINASQQKLAIIQKLKLNEDEWEFLLTISNLSGATKEFNLLEVYKKYPELEATLGLARAYKISGEYQKAILYAQQALQVAREVKNSGFEASALLILASASSSLAISDVEYQNSLKFAQQALILARQIKNLEFESEALNYIAYIYSSLEEYPKALEFAETSLAVARKSKDPWAVYDPLLNLAIIYAGLGDYQKMNQFSQEALMTARKISPDPKFEVIVLNLIALNQFIQGNYQKTITSTQEALIVSNKIKIPYTQKNFYYSSYQILSFAYGGLNDYQKAIEFTQKSLEVARDLKNPVSEGYALVYLGDFYRRSGQKQEAITIYNQVLNLAKKIEYSGSLALVNLGLARTYRDLNQPTTAITFYQKTIDDIEKTRGRIRGLSKELQSSFVQSTFDTERSTVADIYREYASLLFSQGRTLEANQVLELIKVQELSEFRNSPKTIIPKPTVQTPVEAKLIQKYGSLIAFGQKFDECQKTKCQENNQLYEERDGLFTEFRQTIAILEKDTRDRLSKDDDSLKPQDVRAVGKKIVEAKEGTVLINIFIVQDKTWLLWVSKGGVVKTIEVNVGESKIRDTVKKFRQLLQNDKSDVNELKATGKQLYDWLIKPIEPELKANKIQNLVFSLDRATRYIPMSALFDGKQYLIENYNISTILSANLTDTTDRLPIGVENTPVLALGLSKAVSGFVALSNVPAELDGIVRDNPTPTKGIYPGNKFINEKFDYRTLQNNLGGHKILHLATHGVFVSGRRNESYLLLGTGDKLAISQIDNLEALSDIHLVVLSACETALGETGNDGIEISGISNSFLNRQAKAVMASLWVVADKSTSILMQQFYTNLASSEHPTKAEALRQAQLGLLYGQNLNKQNVKQAGGLTPILPSGKSPTNRQRTGNFSHPYYWAPFILIGNGL